MFLDFLKLNESSISLDEARVVTFDGELYPENGWAVILAGGPGSGKSYSLNYKIPLDAKVFDKDAINDLYMKMCKRDPKLAAEDPNGGEYNLKNSEDTTTLFNTVNKKAYYNKKEKVFLGNAGGRLPNIVYDTTGTNGEIASMVADKLHDIGYKVSFVWIITNRDVAKDRNANRDRVVDPEYFDKVHDDAKYNIPQYLRSTAGEHFDEAWLVFSSGSRRGTLGVIDGRQLRTNPVVKLEKNGKNFHIDSATARRLNRILGNVIEH